MAETSKQWLERYPQKSFGHWPVGVELEIDNRCDRQYCKVHNIAAEIKAVKGLQYIPLYLTPNDVSKVIRELLPVGGEGTRRKAAVEYLSNLDDAALLDLMGEVLAKRKAEKK